MLVYLKITALAVKEAIGKSTKDKIEKAVWKSEAISVSEQDAIAQGFQE